MGRSSPSRLKSAGSGFANCSLLPGSVYSSGRGASIFSRVRYTRRDATAVEFNVSQTRGSAIVLFAHGARDPSWAEPFHRMVERLRQKQPATRIELAFLECM